MLLDVAATAPAAVRVSLVGASNGPLATAKPEEANNGRHEPQQGREESEGNDRLGLAACVTAERDISPRKYASTGTLLQVLLKSNSQ